MGNQGSQPGGFAFQTIGHAAGGTPASSLGSTNPKYYYSQQDQAAPPDHFEKSTQAKSIAVDEKDPFTSWPLRGGGFANELGESSKHLLGNNPLGQSLSKFFVRLTWGITSLYAMAHTGYRARKAYHEAEEQTGDKTTARAHSLKEGVVTGLYQLMASVLGPVILIHNAQKWVRNAFNQSRGITVVKGMTEDQLVKNLNELPISKKGTSNSSEIAKLLKKQASQESSSWIGHLGSSGRDVFSDMPNKLKRLVGKNTDLNDSKQARKSLAALGSQHINSLAGNTMKSHFKSPAAGRAALMFGAGMIAILGWCKVFDPVVESIKEHILEPIGNWSTNKYLASKGKPTYKKE